MQSMKEQMSGVREVLSEVTGEVLTARVRKETACTFQRFLEAVISRLLDTLPVIDDNDLQTDCLHVS